MKIIRIGYVICATLLLLCGCGVDNDTTSEHPQKKPIELRWLVDNKIGKSKQDYFNELLQEKGYPYKVLFEAAEWGQYQELKTQYAEEKTPLDIMLLGPMSADASISKNVDVFSGLALPLDSYFDTERGKFLQEQYVQDVWKYSKINGVEYGIPSPISPPAQFTILWNKDIAAKYDIELEKWDQPIYHYEDAIMKVYMGEKENPQFKLIGNADFLNVIFPEYTQIFYTYPFYISETAEGYTVLSEEEIPEYHGMTKFLANLEQAGFSDEYVQTPEYFLLVYPISNTDEQLKKILGEEYKEKYGVLRLEDLYLRQENLGFYNSIASWSLHPNEAFDLLVAVSTDKDLSNALSWGIPEQDYDIVDGAVVERDSPQYPNVVGGNYWITTSGVLEPSNKEDLFYKLYSEAKPAKLLGFRHNLSEVSGASEDQIKAELQRQIDLWVQKKE